MNVKKNRGFQGKAKEARLFPRGTHPVDIRLPSAAHKSSANPQRPSCMNSKGLQAEGGKVVKPPSIPVARNRRSDSRSGRPVNSQPVINPDKASGQITNRVPYGSARESWLLPAPRQVAQGGPHKPAAPPTSKILL